MSRKMYFTAIAQRSVGVMKKAINASCIRGIHAIGASVRSMTSCQRSGTVMIVSFHSTIGPHGPPQGVSDAVFGAVRGSATGTISGVTTIAGGAGITTRGKGSADVSYETRRVFGGGCPVRPRGVDGAP